MRDRRARSMLFALAAVACCGASVFQTLPSGAWVYANESITRPMVSEATCPLELFTPVASDGHRGQGILRKPPGSGPFPAVVWIHGGLQTRSLDGLKDLALNQANPSRFLAAGYVLAVITYRSRDHDPQAKVSLEDCLAAVDQLRRLSFIDPQSIVIYGCSGGGDLALEVGAATQVCAIVPEEPASILLTGIFNAKFPKKGERHTPLDAAPISENPKHYYTTRRPMLRMAKCVEPDDAPEAGQVDHRLECLGGIPLTPRVLRQYVARHSPVGRFKPKTSTPEEPAVHARHNQIRTPGPPIPFGIAEL